MNNLIVYDNEINDFKDLLIKCFGINNYNKMDINDLKLRILKEKVIKNIINCKKGDIIYKFDKYKGDIESNKEYVVYKIGNNNNLMGNDDIVINNGNGYIAGGLNGRAVLKEDWKYYIEVKGGLK